MLFQFKRQTLRTPLIKRQSFSTSFLFFSFLAISICVFIFFFFCFVIRKIYYMHAYVFMFSLLCFGRLKIRIQVRRQRQQVNCSAHSVWPVLRFFLLSKDPNESSWVLKSINIYHKIKFASNAIFSFSFSPTHRMISSDDQESKIRWSQQNRSKRRGEKNQKKKKSA